MSADDDPPRGRPGRFVVVAFALAVHGVFAVLAVVGVLVVAAMVRDWHAGAIETTDAVFIGGFGIVMTLIGAGFFWLAYVGGPRFLGRLERERWKHRDRPWLTDRRWRARRVVHAGGSPWFLWIWCLAWWGILGFLWSMNHELIMADLRGSWSEAIPTAIPFVAGILGVLAAIGGTWQRWRYGKAVLLIDTLPGYLGERFGARVQARLAHRPDEPIDLTLACVSRRRERRSKGEAFVDDELWSASRRLNPTQTTFDRSVVTVPVSFELPAEQPESGHLLDEPQIVWTLAVRSGRRTRGALASTFEVPVFGRRDPP